MIDYVKPSLQSSLNYFILHAGTNDLSSNKSSEEIARSIIDLATSIKGENHVSIFNIIIQTDGKQLEEKRRDKCYSDESLDAESTTYHKMFPMSLRTSKTS